MDCSSEEQLIIMHLSKLKNIKNLDFDLEKRQLDVYHEGENEEITKLIDELNLDSKLLDSEEYYGKVKTNQSNIDKKYLIIVLLINLAFFILEAVTGVISNSMGLIADSLDMLADVIVYGLSLYAINSLVSRKQKIAKISGYFQLLLAVFGFIEVIRRSVDLEDVPQFQTMIGISLLALIGNMASLIILKRSKSDEINIKASWIFTSNDVIVNIGVIIAGILVYLTQSSIPDLLVGSAIFLIVARGAFTILKLAK